RREGNITPAIALALAERTNPGIIRERSGTTMAPRVRWLPLLVGSVLVAGGALGAWWHHRHDGGTAGAECAPAGAEDCGCKDGEDDGLTLPESERKYLWDVEHGGNLLVRHGFGPMSAALRRGDAAGLLALLSEDFQGHVLREPREVASRADWLTVVRQMNSGQ